MINTNKSPYHGLPIAVAVMVLPSPILSLVLYPLFNAFQPQHTKELNLVSAVAIGFGLGFIYHMSCAITGAYADSWQVVKNRIKEFFEDLTVSFTLALKWYWNDIKTNGIAFWIYFAVISVNFAIFVNALVYFFKLLGALS